MPHKRLPRPAMKFIPPQHLIWLWFRGPCFLLVTHRMRPGYCSPVYQHKFCQEFRRKQSQPFSKWYTKGQLFDNRSSTTEGAREEKSNIEPARTFKWRFLNAPGGTKNRGSNPSKIYWATWECNIIKSLLQPTKFGSDRLCFSTAPMPLMVASFFSAPFKT